jgi:processive 1,2-diacylglycerol beta-glucosyltransferase
VSEWCTFVGFPYVSVHRTVQLRVAERACGLVAADSNALRLRRRHEPPTPRACSARRVLILTADVGEGHAAAARALREQLESCGEPVEVAIIDGLAAMGERLRSIVSDGYRTQLRVAPRSYSLYYWSLEHLAPMRWLTTQMLCRLGAASLRREILRRNPDVVVSTYPAITVVLSRLRRRRQIDMPTVATITDMTGLFFWAQRGIDTHLVMYDQSVPDVERIAGRGSAQVVRPLISAEFLAPRERGAARAALDLPAIGNVVVVSGGGWGVGDLEGAVEELSTLADTTVVCVAGRNDAARGRLEQRFAGDAEVRVLGFTDRMPDLLAAADVLVHSTGGVTCLEAMARGCPVVSYGLPVGHAKLNTAAMAAHEYVLLADSPRALVEHVKRGCALRSPRSPAAALSAALDAASAVLEAPRRVVPIARWRLRLASVASVLLLTLGGGVWVMSTDELDAAASVLVHPVAKVKTSEPVVALVVRLSNSADAANVARHLGVDELEASIATTAVPTRGTLALMRRDGDESIPAINRAGVFGWLHTSSILRRDARALHLHHHFFYLEPSHPSVGQLLLARTAGGTPVRGSVAVDSRTPLRAATLDKGAVIVVTLTGSSGSCRVLERLAESLRANDLVALPLSDVLS